MNVCLLTSLFVCLSVFLLVGLLVYNVFVHGICMYARPYART